MDSQLTKSKDRPRRALFQGPLFLLIGLLLAAACTISIDNITIDNIAIDNITIDFDPSDKPTQTAKTTLTAVSIRPTAVSATPAAAKGTSTAVIREFEWDLARGSTGDWWRVYFNKPSGDSDPSGYVGGMDQLLADAIADARDTLDIAAFEMDSETIYEAILAAHQRGVRVRIVTDDERGLGDENDAALRDLQAAGVAVVDDGRSALMHNKFMIMDGKTVWTGSWNYTVNGTYRNNNNVLAMENATAAAAYQAEFDEMFIRGEFGTRSTDDGIATFRENGAEVSIIFAAEADEIPILTAEIQKAEHSIRFMVFVFSLDELAVAILEMMANPDIRVQGIFEKRNSTARWSQLPPLHCAGADIRQDGNRYTLHHKVFIIDDDTVITGSFNFSNSAANSNDENIVIIRDPTIAGLYLEEWENLWDSAEYPQPGEVECD